MKLIRVEFIRFLLISSVMSMLIRFKRKLRIKLLILMLVVVFCDMVFSEIFLLWCCIFFIWCFIIFMVRCFLKVSFLLWCLFIFLVFIVMNFCKLLVLNCCWSLFLVDFWIVNIVVWVLVEKSVMNVIRDRICRVFFIE